MKQNETPKLPKGWEVKKLGIKKLVDISTFFDDGNWIERKDQSSEGIRLIQTGNVGNGTFKDKIEKARYISVDTFKRLRCKEIFEGDCLVSRLPDPVGRACILPNTGEKMITAVDCTIIRFDSKLLISNWFLYYSLSSKYQNDIQKQITGSTRQRISRKNLGLISIPLPPLPEQKRIVSKLDEAFTALAKAKANAEQNLKNAKELFESYLQSPMDNGKGWEVKKLGEVCKLSAGGDIPKNNFSKSITEKYKVPIYANGEKNKGLFGFTNIAKISEPSITVSARGTIGYSEIRLEEFYPIVRLIVITPKDKTNLDLHFLSYSLKTINFKNSGTSIPQLTIPMIKDYTIPLPPLHEQKSIVAKLDALKAETTQLEKIYKQKIASLNELKKAILSKAFEGEL